jgi:hypothetical protein
MTEEGAAAAFTPDSLIDASADRYAVLWISRRSSFFCNDDDDDDGGGVVIDDTQRSVGCAVKALVEEIFVRRLREAVDDRDNMRMN